jgi:hypothetical protein
MCDGVSPFLFLSKTMPKIIPLSEYDVQRKGGGVISFPADEAHGAQRWN